MLVIKMKSKILNSAHVQSMVAALKSAGISCEKTATTRVCTATNSQTGVKEVVFRAMKHSRNRTWLVSYSADLFV